MKQEDFESCIHYLTGLPKETEWVEWKQNFVKPEDIGEYISALSNAAALHGKNAGYLIWGIEDSTRKIVGTSFKPKTEKEKGQELENWLSTQLVPRIDFQIIEGVIEGLSVVLFQIQPAAYQPVRFKDAEFIRVGSYKKRLRDHPEKERALWTLFAKEPFENGIAAPNVDSDAVISLLDYTKYFRLVSAPLPDNRQAILDKLMAEKVIVQRSADRYDITNGGAILYAAKLEAFDRLSRKAVRVIIYDGVNRTKTKREQTGGRGYAVGFEGLIKYINDQLPQNEMIGQALRREVRTYPEIAIRELVANALIHQDFNVTGTGPTVEIFDDRMEITNPGTPLIDPLRFIDEPPRSRNEILAAMMRRMNMCEERGSGIDKVISNIEIFQLPAPDFRVTASHTVAVMFGPREFGEMDKEDRIRACYQHSCLLYVSGKTMTNTTLRKRLGIDDKNYPMASRIISDTIEARLIKAHTQSGESKRYAKYVPFWA
jgi:predicted HTH transcriptional regulator